MAQEQPVQSIPTSRLQISPGRRRSTRSLSIPDGPPYGIKTEPTTVITPPSPPRYPTHLSIKKKKKQGRFHLSSLVRNRVIVVLLSPIIFVGVGLGLILLLILLGVFVVLLPFGAGWAPLQAMRSKVIEVYKGYKIGAVKQAEGVKNGSRDGKVAKIEASAERKGTYAEAIKANNGTQNGAVKVNDAENGSGKGEGKGTKIEWAKRHEDMRELNRKRSEVEMAGKGDERTTRVSTLEVPAEEEFDSCDVSSGFQF